MLSRGLLLFTLIVSASILVGVPSLMYSPVSTDVSKIHHNAMEFLSKNILFDESHTGGGSSLWSPGNASLFSWLLSVNGYNSSTNFESPLDSGILDNYDVLVLFFPYQSLTVAEINAIHDFVWNGGGIVLVGVDNLNWWNFRSSNLNPISEAYGVHFNSDEVRGSTSQLVSHHINYMVDQVYINGDDLFGCTLTLNGNATAVVTTSGSPIVATVEAGAGRVVFCGMPGPFYMYRAGAFDYGPSNAQFTVNIIDWVTGNPQRNIQNPSLATIRLGGGPSLSESELEDYEVFVGLIHDHTTHSDGADSATVMLEAGLNRGLDFMYITDHSHLNPNTVEGVYGALEAKSIVDKYGLDIHMGIGAELSSVKHTLGFPLTENIWTSNQQTAVDQIHAQGGIAVLCHPTIGSDYAPVYENFSVYGYDAVEVVNSGFFFGGGEDGYRYNFIGASDGHAASFVGQILNAVFVPRSALIDGRISDAVIVDAILNRRLVIIDRVNNMLYGQNVWINLFLERMADAEAAFDAGQTYLDGLRSSGHSVGLSEEYMRAAEAALMFWNPGRTLRMVANATSIEATNIDISIEFNRVVYPSSDPAISLRVVNRHTYSILINTSIYVLSSLELDHLSRSLVIPDNNTLTIDYNGTVGMRGLLTFWLNIVSINTTTYLSPVMLSCEAAIDNVTTIMQQRPDGMYVRIIWFIDALAKMRVSSVSLIYNDGTGAKTVEMNQEFSTFTYELGPYTQTVNITFTIRITTTTGGIYELSEQVLYVRFAIDTGFWGYIPVIIIGVVGVFVIAIFVIIRKRT